MNLMMNLTLNNMKKLLFLLLILTACSKDEINTTVFMDAACEGLFTVRAIYPGTDTILKVMDYWSQSVTVTTGDTVELTVFTTEKRATISINNCFTTAYGYSWAKLKYTAP